MTMMVWFMTAMVVVKDAKDKNKEDPVDGVSISLKKNARKPIW